MENTVFHIVLEVAALEVHARDLNTVPAIEGKSTAFSFNRGYSRGH